MAKIKNAKVKTKSGGYERVFDNNEVGLIFSKVQSTVISNGSELENIIINHCNLINDLNDFIDRATIGNVENNVYVCQKHILKKSRYYLEGHQPDLLVFIVEQRRVCKVIELKDGDNFDTKKARSEYESLKEFCNYIGAKIPFVTEFYLCCFNQLNKQSIVEGFKGRFTTAEVMTGKELCEILRIDYQNIVNERKKDANDNMQYLIDELMKIPSIREYIKKKKDEF